MSDLQGGPVRPVKLLTDADLEENGGSYVLRNPKIAELVSFDAAPDRTVQQGNVMPVYRVTQAQVDAGQFIVKGGRPRPVTAVSGKPVRGKVAVAVFDPDYTAGGGVVSQTYAEILRDTYGADEVWPLVDISSGTDIKAFINSNRDGTLSGWGLQNTAGPVTGTLAPYSDGANDYGDISSENGVDGIVDIFDQSVGAVMGWAKVTDNTVWTDGANHFLFVIDETNPDRMRVWKAASSDSLRFRLTFNSSSTLLSLDSATGSDEWFMFGFSWNQPGNECILWAKGAFGEFSDTGGIGDTLANTPANWFVGSEDSMTDVWSGWMAYMAVKFGSIWTPTDFANIYAAASTAAAD